jgi:murein DD-endopeptidase MepM/ murein hydrolase activator NlpD
VIALLAALLVQTAEADPIGDLIASQAPGAGESASEVITMVHQRLPNQASDVCHGEFIQGGAVVCFHLGPGRLSLGDSEGDVNAAGFVVLGIPRDAPTELEFVFGLNADAPRRLSQPITQREYNIQTVTGVPQRTVTPDESTLPRRQREYAQKQAAFNSTWDGQGFLDGFIAPAEGITTGVYGSQRVYNGTPGNPHWGLDWANDVGTPIVAPAGGLVTLAEADMFYEGGLIFIDHGQGLVSAFLHMSAVHVSEGDIVTQGQLIGEIGAGGRATGAHLDWRVKLRNGFYVDPALLMELDVSGLRDAE